MPALVAGIHAFLPLCSKQDVDAPHKAGHDALKVLRIAFIARGRS
jgi:hypothetical protein